MSNKKFYVKFRFDEDPYPMWMYLGDRLFGHFTTDGQNVPFEMLVPKTQTQARSGLESILIEFGPNNNEIKEFIKDLWEEKHSYHTFKCNNDDFPRVSVEGRITSDPIYDWDEVETGDTSIRESKIIFDSILNEEAGRTNYPQKQQFNNGKVKKVPLVMKYIYENPGCTKEDIINFTNSMGFTGLNNELLIDIRDDGLAETRPVNSRGKLGFYPTDIAVGYLHSLGFINDTSGDEAYKDFATKSSQYKTDQIKRLAKSVIENAWKRIFNKNLYLFKSRQYELNKYWKNLNEEERRQVLLNLVNKLDLS